MAFTNASTFAGLGGVLKGDYHSIDPEALLALAVILLTSLFLWRTLTRSMDDALRSLPQVSPSIPFLGLGPAYFGGPFPLFLRLKKEYGDTFVSTVFGKSWVFCLTRDDHVAIYKAPENQISMLRPVQWLAGFTFPQECRSDYPTEELYKKISMRGGLGPSNVFSIVHSLKKDKMMAWILPLQKVLKDAFAELPDEGTVSLFDWCQELITTITVWVLLGESVTHNKELLKTYTKLFNEGDPEVGFAGPFKVFQTMIETQVLGERRAFPKLRALLEPYFDAEVQRICIDKVPEDPSESVMQSFIRSWHQKLNQDVEALKCAKRRILNELFLFTFAAFSNSYGGAAWLVYHIIGNTSGCGDKVLPEIQQMQQKWSEAAKEGKIPTEFNCPNLEWTLTEVARLYTPGAVLREAMIPFKLPSTGVTVPPGTMINLSVGMISRDPRVFPNPLTFDPNRHSPEQKSANPNYFMTTFGAGAHPCAGKKFAVYEMALFVMEALAEFDMTIEPGPPTDEFTKQAIGKTQENHPPLDPFQAGFIWRPTEPVVVQYKRKTTCK